MNTTIKLANSASDKDGIPIGKISLDSSVGMGLRPGDYIYFSDLTAHLISAPAYRDIDLKVVHKIVIFKHGEGYLPDLHLIVMRADK